MLKQRIIRLSKAIEEIRQADAPRVIVIREDDGLFTECSAWAKGCPLLPCEPCNPCSLAMQNTVTLIDDIGSDDDE